MGATRRAVVIRSARNVNDFTLDRRIASFPGADHAKEPPKKSTQHKAGKTTLRWRRITLEKKFTALLRCNLRERFKRLSFYATTIALPLKCLLCS